MTTGERELTLRVQDKVPCAEGVVALVLVDPSGAELPAWEPGAHLDLELAPDLVRQYSLCGDPADRTAYRVGVLREPDGRGGSARVHDGLQVGDEVLVRGPRNHFALVEADSYVFVAGGIGITPLLPMLAEVGARGADYAVAYGGRARASMAFLDELQERHGERLSVLPQDETGLLDLPAILGAPRPGTAVYCCGPEPLLEAVESVCAAWPAGALHVERFAPKPVLDGAADRAFEVLCKRSGTTVTVPVGTTLLEALEDAGVDIDSSCREGTCGTCETDVLEGVPDHRDSLLSPEEQAAGDVMFPCVSRCTSDLLVLDR